MRSTEEDGAIRHCERCYRDVLIMMGGPPGHRAPVDPVTVGICEHARAASANVQGPPEDMPYAVRSYGALDLEGHQWWFAAPLSH